MCIVLLITAGSAIGAGSMSLLDRLLRPQTASTRDSTLENPSVDLTQAIVAMTDGTTISSVSLTPAKSLRLTAVYACVKCIAESVGSLPVNIKEDAITASGRRSRVYIPDERQLLLELPNPELTAME